MRSYAKQQSVQPLTIRFQDEGNGMRRYTLHDDEWVDVPLIRYYVKPIGRHALLEVILWFKAAGNDDDFISSGIFIESADLGYGNGLGVDLEHNPTAYQQVSVLRAQVRYNLSRSLRACVDVTPALVRQAVGQYRKPYGHCPESDFICNQLGTVLSIRILSRNERTALKRRLHELTVSLTDGFVQNPAI